ncbi:hypothetical protein F2Q68_00021682 [Brassica cretica]|nr:hypothetical protein F2Q68_00021682 [Brassica cretica]
MASLVAHAVMKHCRYSDCLCGVLSKSQGRTRKQDNRNFSCIVKTLVDAFIVVWRDLVGTTLASCVMLNKGKHIVEVVSMLVTILQYQAYLQETIL